MEHSGISVEAGPLDLSQEQQLDFDPNVEFEVEGLDFGLDGSYEEIEHELVEGVSDVAAAPDLGLESDYADRDSHAATADDEHTKTPDSVEETGNDAAAEAEYQDEIGYEDDDLVAADVTVGTSNAEAVDAELGLSNTFSEGRLEAAEVVDDSHTQALAPAQDAPWNREIDFEDHGESTDPQHGLGDAGEGEATEHLEGHDPTGDDFDDQSADEDSTAAHHDIDLDKALAELSQSLPEFPNIEVLYNEDRFSLLGTSDDDPDSYFLSDVKELDRPLSQFLAAVREVISDELTPTDELVIRVDSLELEFGERSNEKFLNRSFRELLGCHATLSRASDTSANPTIHLMVRRDSEEHFLDLLAQAKLAEESFPGAGDSEMSEDLDVESPDNALDDGQMQDEPVEGESFEYYDEGEHVVTADNAEDKAEPELKIPSSDDNVAEEQEQDIQAGSDAPQSPDASPESFDGKVHEEDIQVETHAHEFSGDTTGDAQTWNEQATEDDATSPQQVEVTLELSEEQVHELTEQQDGDEAPEMANSSGNDGAIAGENGGPEQDAGSNDDDLILTFNDDTVLPTIDEEVDGHEEYTITYDAADNSADGENMPEPGFTETLREYGNNDSENGAHVASAEETSSIHTSSTIKGDEIDYDEENVAGESFTPAVDDTHQSTASGIDNDEIDWENDEDEHQQQPAGGDDSADYKGSQEASLTPPSVAGKRSRTDEAESLADETDHKRRRT